MKDYTRFLPLMSRISMRCGAELKPCPAYFLVWKKPVPCKSSGGGNRYGRHFCSYGRFEQGIRSSHPYGLFKETQHQPKLNIMGMCFQASAQKRRDTPIYRLSEKLDGPYTRSGDITRGKRETSGIFLYYQPYRRLEG